VAADLTLQHTKLIAEGQDLGLEPGLGPAADDQDLEQQASSGVEQGQAGHGRRRGLCDHLVAAAGVEREAPEAGGAAVAEPAQGQHRTIGQYAVHVGEGTTEANPNIGQLRPALTLASDQSLAERGLGALGDASHITLPGGPAFDDLFMSALTNASHASLPARLQRY
jgi:hypothetical protein